MLAHHKQNRLKSSAGYTIDQTILIVAIIAILITMIISTVGWELIARTSGAKVAAQLRQIEDAIGQFYATHRQWPNQAINSAGTTAAQAQQVAYALTGNHPGYTSNIETSSLKNYVTGLRVAGAVGTTNALLMHDFGGGDPADIVRVYVRSVPASTQLNTANTYMIVEMIGVPSAEVLQADEIIDGDDSGNTYRAQRGRVYFTEGTSTCVGGGSTAAFSTNTAKSICYVANLVQ